MIPSKGSAANGRNGIGLHVWQRVGHLGKRPNLETFDTGGLSLFDAQQSCPGHSSALAVQGAFIDPKTVSPSDGFHPAPANGETSISGHLTTERENAPACVDVLFRPQLTGQEDL